MEKEQTQQEELNKSIDALIEEIFADEEVSKSIDIAKDSKTTADAALAGVEMAQNDEDRGAGRPKQISDVPAKDQDGSRAKEYDGAIAQAKNEDEPEEAKKQAKSVDQISKEGRMGEGPKMTDPRIPPFRKSLTEEEYAEFEAFKKAKKEKEDQSKKDEELRKAQSVKKEQETLIKAAVESAILGLRKENEDLRKSFTEQNELIKALGSQPQKPKSITNIQALEKSADPSLAAPEAFSKSEMLDAAEALVKSNHIKDEHVMELELTGTVVDPTVRALIEKKLKG